MVACVLFCNKGSYTKYLIFHHENMLLQINSQPLPLSWKLYLSYCHEVLKKKVIAMKNEFPYVRICINKMQVREEPNWYKPSDRSGL